MKPSVIVRAHALEVPLMERLNGKLECKKDSEGNYKFETGRIIVTIKPSIRIAGISISSPHK